MHLNVMWDNEDVYVVIGMVHHAMSGWGGEPGVHGLTKNKEHAEAIRKEFPGSEIHTTHWTREWP